MQQCLPVYYGCWNVACMYTWCNSVSVFLQICIAFQLFRGLSVIPKTVTKERVHQNLAATKVKLTQEDMERLYAINRNVRYVRLFMVKKGQSQEEYWDIERDAKFMGASWLESLADIQFVVRMVEMRNIICDNSGVDSCGYIGVI